MIAEWFVLVNSDAIGPYTQEQILGLIEQGSLQPTSFVRRLDGPWMTVATAYTRLTTTTAMNPAPMNTSPMGMPGMSPSSGPFGAQYHAAPMQAGYAPAPAAPPPSAPYKRRTKSQLRGLLMTSLAIAIGGAAAVYTAKNFLKGLTPLNPATAGTEVVEVPETESNPQATGSAKRSVAIGSRGAAGGSIGSAAGEARPTQWLQTMQGIAARRQTLVAKRNELQREMQPLVDQAESIDRACKSRELQAQQMHQSITDQTIERDRMLAALNGKEDAAVTKKISTLTAEIEVLQGKLAQLDTSERRTTYRELMTQVAPLEKRAQVLLRDADHARDELVRHLNPFVEITEPLATAALAYFNDPVVEEEAVSRAWNQFGAACIHMRRGDEASAAESLKGAIATAPSEGTFRAVRGYWRLRLGNAADALPDLTAAVQDDAKNGTVQYLMALYQLKQGKPATAEMHLQKCRDIDIGNFHCAVLLSLVKSTAYDEKHRSAEIARQCAEQALSLERSAASYFAMSAALAEAGSFSEAQEYAKQVAPSPSNKREFDFYRQVIDPLKSAQSLRLDWTTVDVWNCL